MFYRKSGVEMLCQLSQILDWMEARIKLSYVYDHIGLSGIVQPLRPVQGI